MPLEQPISRRPYVPKSPADPRIEADLTSSVPIRCTVQKAMIASSLTKMSRNSANQLNTRLRVDRTSIDSADCLRLFGCRGRDTADSLEVSLWAVFGRTRTMGTLVT